MKLTKNRCRVTGVQVGEISVNTINPGSPPLSAHIVLLRDDGERVGKYTRISNWGPKVEESLVNLIDCVEEAVLQELFDPPENSKVSDPQVGVTAKSGRT